MSRMHALVSMPPQKSAFSEFTQLHQIIDRKARPLRSSHKKLSHGCSYIKKISGSALVSAMLKVLNSYALMRHFYFHNINILAQNLNAQQYVVILQSSFIVDFDVTIYD